MASRKSIYTDAFGHSNPIPAACRLGPLLVTGIINGEDTSRPDGPGSFEEQCALMFRRISEVLAAAGASTDQIVKINFSVPDLNMRDALNREWVTMFPEEANRPARQTTRMDLDRGKLIQCDVMAWLGD
jgi:2-iminobutanoate/2-iminopropanoate deaminase